MSFVLVLVGMADDHEKPSLRPDHLARVEGFLDRHNIRFDSNPVWLQIHRAAEMNIDDKPTPSQWRDLQDMLDPERIDVFVVPAMGRRKKLFLADMDSTIIHGETLDELAGVAGIKQAVADITDRAMRGELDFKQALETRVALLKDLPVSALQQTLENLHINPGAEALVKTMRHAGTVCILVSGGFTFFTRAAGGILGFNADHGNTLEISGNKLTGKVVPPILDKESKLAFLRDYQTKLNLDASDIAAVGDGANDIPMLQAAGLGVGYQPKPVVRDAIENNIRHTNLTSLLYMQGYHWQEIEHAVQCNHHHHHA